MPPLATPLPPPLSSHPWFLGYPSQITKNGDTFYIQEPTSYLRASVILLQEEGLKKFIDYT